MQEIYEGQVYLDTKRDAFYIVLEVCTDKIKTCCFVSGKQGFKETWILDLKYDAISELTFIKDSFLD